MCGNLSIGANASTNHSLRQFNALNRSLICSLIEHRQKDLLPQQNKGQNTFTTHTHTVGEEEHCSTKR